MKIIRSTGVVVAFTFYCTTASFSNKYLPLLDKSSNQLKQIKLIVNANDLLVYSRRGNSNLEIGVSCPKNRKIYPMGLKFDSDDMILELDSIFKVFELQFYYDEKSNPVEQSDENISILGILSDVEYSQRIVADRISNPHGEHAEEMWTTNLMLSNLSNLKESTCNLPINSPSRSACGDGPDTLGCFVLLCHRDLHNSDAPLLNSILYLRNVG